MDEQHTSDDHHEPPAGRGTRAMVPGMTRRMSMSMGSMTLAGAAFFGVAVHDGTMSDAATNDGTGTSSIERPGSAPTDA
jgi:hypothetical protein